MSPIRKNRSQDEPVSTGATAVSAGGSTAGAADDETSDERRGRRPSKVEMEGNPRWWAPVMLGLMLLGLVWLVVYYLSNFELPIKALHNWNMGVGFGLIMIGFFMTTRWN